MPYKIQHGILYRDVSRDPTTSTWRIFLPQDLRLYAMQELHDSPLHGHMGIDKSIDNISSRFWWPTLREDVTQYVRSCLTCQRNKTPRRLPPGNIHHRRIHLVWHTLHLDLIGPLIRSTRNFTNILVVVDTFSKWVEVYPLRHGTTAEIITHLHRLFTQFGFPAQLHSDNGSVFKSRAFQEYARSWGIRLSTNPPYTPQCNLTERYNQTLEDMIRAYLHGFHTHWDDHLYECAFAIRSTVNASTKFSPAELMFGRPLPHPLDHQLEPIPPDETPPEYFQGLRSRLDTIHSRARDALRLAQSKQIRYHNQRHVDVQYHPGDLVLVREHPISSLDKHRMAKLCFPYSKPFQIVTRLGHNIYEIVSYPDKKVYGRQHVSNLKPYVLRDPPLVTSPPSRHSLRPRKPINYSETRSVAPRRSPSKGGKV